jgi:long-chain acyl-CoA synthetase
MSEVLYKSIPDMLRDHATRYADHLALKYRRQGKLQLLTYPQLYERALMVSRGLRKFGIGPGDKVAILSENRAGWVIADMGILALGAISVPIYPTSTADQIEYMLNHSEAKIVFVSNKYQYLKLLKMRSAIPRVTLVSPFERFIGDPSLPVCHFYTLSEIDDPITEEERKEIEVFIDAIKPEALMTIIYTSGTTGMPKGVMLSHYNALFAAQKSSEKAAVVSHDDTFLSFLPLSHVLERVVGYYMTIMEGCLMTFAENMDKVPANMREYQPSVMISVPRLFEKAYARIFENVHEMPLIKKWIFHWAVAKGKRYVDIRYVQQAKVPFGLGVAHAIGDALVFKKIRGLLGGNLRAFCSGGAPLDKTINEFFWIIGLPILEGYGLTETSAPVSLNTLTQLRFGSVGTPMEGVEFKVAGDGELLVKGPPVMMGYYKDPEATKEAMDGQWLRTGDIGKIEEGYIYITDRKKELIITAAGKNIAPQPIENELKLDKFISQAMVYGDRKPFLVALIVPNFDRVREFAKDKHINYFDDSDLVLHEEVEALMAGRIADVNARLAKFETIKRFAILPRDFTVEGSELTPTLKLRRRNIIEQYGEKIEEMYSENWHGTAVTIEVEAKGHS